MHGSRLIIATFLKHNLQSCLGFSCRVAHIPVNYVSSFKQLTFTGNNHIRQSVVHIWEVDCFALPWSLTLLVSTITLGPQKLFTDFLFRSFIFLKTSNNGPVLLHHAMFGEQALHTQDTTKVLAALKQYIEEDHTFTR
jgi:hypothetical protein